jgi:prepilin-type processing-associated H-X9-DG protein
MRKAVLAATLLAALVLVSGAPAEAPAHHPLYMPDANHIGSPALQPPPVCCVAPPVAGEPAPVNMAYYDGHVQVVPKVYIVFWGWGQAGAFDHTTPGMPANDPDGAAARMTAFIKAFGGTAWAGSRTQYYELDNGQQVHITNPTNQFGDAWFDDMDPIHDNVSGLELAQEAQRAVAHFGITDLHDSQVVVARPQKFNEAGFNGGVGYCAWHDYTQPQDYPGVQPGISFTNMPYVLNMGASCGQNSPKHRLLRGQARRLHDRHGTRDRGDDHRPRRRGRDQRAEPRRLVRLLGLRERRQVRVGRVRLRHYVAVDRPGRPQQHHGQRRGSSTRPEPVEQQLGRRFRLLRRRGRRLPRHRLSRGALLQNFGV